MRTLLIICCLNAGFLVVNFIFFVSILWWYTDIQKGYERILKVQTIILNKLRKIRRGR